MKRGVASGPFRPFAAPQRTPAELEVARTCQEHCSTDAIDPSANSVSEPFDEHAAHIMPCSSNVSARGRRASLRGQARILAQEQHQ